MSALRDGVRPRAVVGGLLVTLALLGVAQAHARADAPPRTRFVAVLRTIAPGAILGTADLALVAAELPGAVADRGFTSVDGVIGGRVLAPLQPGDLLLRSHVTPADTPAPPGADIAFSLPTERALGGRLRPGEQVDLVATLPAGPTRLVADDALVLAVDQGGTGLLSEADRLVLTVRLVGPGELLAVVGAADEGALTVARDPEGPVA